MAKVKQDLTTPRHDLGHFLLPVRRNHLVSFIDNGVPDEMSKV